MNGICTINLDLFRFISIGIVFYFDLDLMVIILVTNPFLKFDALYFYMLSPRYFFSIPCPKECIFSRSLADTYAHFSINL